MTPHEATLYSALIASAGALLGGLLGSLGTYFIQKHVLKNETIEHAKRSLIDEEINALQHFSVLIDFVEANAGHIDEDFKFFDQLWEIIHACSKSVGFLPRNLRDETRGLIKNLYQGAAGGVVNLDGDNVLRLRTEILNEIDSLKGKPANKALQPTSKSGG